MNLILKKHFTDIRIQGGIINKENVASSSNHNNTGNFRAPFQPISKLKLNPNNSTSAFAKPKAFLQSNNNNIFNSSNSNFENGNNNINYNINNNLQKHHPQKPQRSPLNHGQSQGHQSQARTPPGQGFKFNPSSQIPPPFATPIQQESTKQQPTNLNFPATTNAGNLTPLATLNNTPLHQQFSSSKNNSDGIAAGSHATSSSFNSSFPGAQGMIYRAGCI